MYREQGTYTKAGNYSHAYVSVMHQHLVQNHQRSLDWISMLHPFDNDSLNPTKDFHMKLDASIFKLRERMQTNSQTYVFCVWKKLFPKIES